MALARDRLRLVRENDTDCQNTTFLKLLMDEDLDGTKMHPMYNKNSNIAERGTQGAHKI